MRKTRPQDFDPNFKQANGPQPEEIDMGGVVPLKTYDATVSAPATSSFVDDRFQRSAPPERPVRAELPERVERDVRPQRPERPSKRQLKRHSFDIYIDQLEQLRLLKIEAMRRGEERGLSKMIREAVEAYLKQQA